MYRLRVTDNFSSAHFIVNYPGKCANLHGHNWKVEIEVEFKELDELSMAIDFSEAKKYLKEVTDYLDHKVINNLEEFKNKNTTAEVMSKVIFDMLKPKFEAKKGRLRRVILWETENNRVEYIDD
jgi:6-pyruvoyltetrahydropterin/6-carboxytetrahydropterin synthase